MPIDSFTHELLTDQQLMSFNQQTGLICYLQGFCYQNGIGTGINKDQARKCYEFGVSMFQDPLCAYKLMQLLDPKKRVLQQMQNTANKDAVQQGFMNQIYGFGVQKIPVQDLKESVKELERSVGTCRINIPLLQALIKFNTQQNQKNYDYLLEVFSGIPNKQPYYYIILTLLIKQTHNSDKRPQVIYDLLKSINSDDYLQQVIQYTNQCQYDLEILKASDSHYANTLREVIIEHFYFHKSPVLDKITEMLYNQKISSQIQKVLILRRYAKQTKSFQVQEEEFNLIKSPITNYFCAKYTNIPCYYCLFKVDIPEEVFSRFVYLFYDAKVKMNHKHKQSILPEDLFNTCNEVYEKNLSKFSQVRTLQFIFLKRRLYKQTFKIKIINEQFQEEELTTRVRKQQQIELENKIFEQKRQQHLLALEHVIIDFQDEPQKTKRQSKSYFHGPQMPTDMMSSQPSSRMNSISQEYKSLNFLDMNQVTQMQFLRKSNRDGELYTVVYQDRELIMKTLSYLNQKQVNRFFDQQSIQLSHTNLRKVIGYALQNMHPLKNEDECLSVCIFCEKYDYNLKQFMLKNPNISSKERWNIAVQITDAVYHLHQNNYKFCNLHPNNILFGKQGIPVLSDYDMETDNETLIRSYVSKQLFNEEPSDLEDSYSLACIFVFLFFNVEFQFTEIILNQKISISNLSQLNPWESQNFEIQLPSTSDQYVKQIVPLIVKGLHKQIDILTILKQLYKLL